MQGGMDIFQILLEAGVVVKLVLALLIGSSIFSWAIILQKQKQFKAVQLANQKFSNYFKNHSNLVDLNQEAVNNQESPLGVMFISGYNELSKIKDKMSEMGQEGKLKQYLENKGIEALSRSLNQGANIATEQLEFRLATLASIGSITPFVGLFGTVWGIIDSFTGLASGGGSIEAVAPGIAEALVATAIGLAAAIPAVWAYNVFSAKRDTMTSQMENFGQDFLNLVERSVLITRES